MTTAATAIMKKSLAGQHDRFGLFSRFEPLFVRARFHHHHATDHSRMLRPAILCTKQMILTWLNSLEPLAGVPTGYRILFHTKRGNKKAVDYVLRRHGQDHCAVNRHMQLVDLAFALSVLQLPHPLFADYLHVDCVRRTALDPKIGQRPPRKQAKAENDRAHCPAPLQQQRSGAWMGTVGLRSAPVFDGEKNDRQKNDRHEKK